MGVGIRSATIVTFGFGTSDAPSIDQPPTYQPNPVDTSDVALPEERIELSEKIAENVHDVWATGRIAEGWTYGEFKNEELLQHPCLIPYSELPESEKAYDRNTAFETLKLIVKMGYTITKSPKVVEVPMKYYTLAKGATPTLYDTPQQAARHAGPYAVLVHRIESADADSIPSDKWHLVSAPIGKVQDFLVK